MKTVVLLIAVALFAAQTLVSLALAPIAIPPAWMRVAPASWSRAAAAAIDARVPAVPAAHVALIRQAIDGGDLDLAARRIARLAPSNDRSVLEGRLAERRGDADAAVAAYLRAGDGEDAARLIDALAQSGSTLEAIRLARQALASLPGGGAHASAEADAWWRLGRLEQRAAYDLPIAQRGPLERQAARAYERAAALAPLSQKYLLAAGNERLNLGEPAAAKPYFDALLKLDPASLDALVGSADVALRTGDRAGARTILARARAIGDDPRIGVLEHEIDR
jgi:tetratricopeptide (TPR) repeat protein